MVECLNMGLHEPESVYSAHKWSSRFFDCCIIMLIQTAYKIYVVEIENWATRRA